VPGAEAVQLSVEQGSRLNTKFQYFYYKGNQEGRRAQKGYKLIQSHFTPINLIQLNKADPSNLTNLEFLKIIFTHFADSIYS
jgi:hypothetical protein